MTIKLGKKCNDLNAWCDTINKYFWYSFNMVSLFAYWIMMKVRYKIYSLFLFRKTNRNKQFFSFVKIWSLKFLFYRMSKVFYRDSRISTLKIYFREHVFQAAANICWMIRKRYIYPHVLLFLFSLFIVCTRFSCLA